MSTRELEPFPDLLSDLPYLQTLDALRIESRRLRDDGLRALVNRGPPSDWDEIENPITIVLLNRSLELAHSLGADSERPALPRVTLEIPKDDGENVPSGTEPTVNLAVTTRHQVPILFAAMFMRSELDRATLGLSEGFFLCTYKILRELYSFHSPDWPLGGARADGRTGPASVFITEECARAFGYLAASLERTARFLDEIRAVGEYRDIVCVNRRLERLGKEWCDLELDREKLSLQSIIEAEAGHIMIGVTKDDWGKELSPLLECVRTLLGDFLKETKKAVSDAKHKIDEYREAEVEEARDERDEAASMRIVLSRSAHGFARDNIDRIEDQVRRLRKRIADRDAVAPPPPSEERSPEEQEYRERFGRGTPWADALAETAVELRRTRRAARRILEPVRRFLEGELHTTIFNVESKRSTRRLRDVALASVAMGLMADDWSENIHRKSLELVTKHLSEDGALPGGRSFYQDTEGLELNVVNAHALRATAQLMQHLPEPVDPLVTEKMLRFFRRGRVPLQGDPERGIAWKRQGVGEIGKPSLWVTSVSVNALDRIRRMLDQKINDRLALHFTTESPEGLRGVPKIRELMCTDLGIASCDWSTVQRKRDLLTKEIEQLRAHLVGHPLRGDRETKTSIILYGPPGTGKTTILESLARTSGVPLLRVTPTDFVIRGAEAVQQHGKAVMRALSMVTRSVILFDEFDPILAERSLQRQPPSNVFAFLTGSMLPRLKHLHEAAAQNRFVYALATNYVDRLDAAAIRPQRFDHKRGVYPPYAASRLCRLVSQLALWERAHGQKVEWDDDGFRKRLARVIDQSASVPTVQLMRRGWFLAPRSSSIPSGTAWSYLFYGGEEGEAGREPWWPTPGDLGLHAAQVLGRPEHFQTLVALDQAVELRMVWTWNKEIEDLALSDSPSISWQDLKTAAGPENAKISEALDTWKLELTALRRERLDQASGDDQPWRPPSTAA